MADIPPDDEGDGADEGWGELVRVTELYGVRVASCASTSKDGTVYVVDFEILELHAFAVVPPSDPEILIEGSVKWDGCCNWYTNEESAVHLCALEQLDELKACFSAVYALAHDLLFREGGTPPQFARPELAPYEQPSSA